MARYPDGRKKAVKYEDTLNPEQLEDLNKKLHSFWESLAFKYKYQTYWNNAAKYRKRLEQ